LGKPSQPKEPVAYNLKRLAEAVVDRLAHTPLVPLRVLARELGVERHTVARALGKHVSTTYRQLQRRSLEARVRRLASVGTPRTSKEIATALGYSRSSALSRRLRRSLDLTLSDVIKRNM
jgi:AraC-like DNA-binding protein